MKIVEGKCVSGGTAIGRLHVLKREEQHLTVEQAKDCAVEIARYHDATKRAIEELDLLNQETTIRFGRESADIFRAYVTMLIDEEYCGNIEQLITQNHMNAEAAVLTASNQMVVLFENLKDEYMKERAADIKDVSQRLLRILSGNPREEEQWDDKMILVAKDISPSEMVRFANGQILGMITESGSVNSHTSILARTMQIPALIGITPKAEWEGCNAVIDADRQCVYINPTPVCKAEYAERKQNEQKQKEYLKALRGQKSVTVDGSSVRLCANVATEADLKTAVDNDAEGIGLFRSEILYLEAKSYPTEEEQFAIYKKAAESMQDREVIIRTMDIGADKQVDYMEQQPEENPALGYRAIRICLTKPEIFKTQLRAILRAGVYGNVAVMYPMITSLQEIEKIERLMREVKQELKQENIAFCENMKAGIMIETPAAALISAKLARKVDFFSIGTNDLTQYILAMDRSNPVLNQFFDPYHEAVLKLIEMTVENGHAAGIPVGICGELGADRNLTKKFLKMKIDVLSIAPGEILSMRHFIRSLSL